MKKPVAKEKYLFYQAFTKITFLPETKFVKILYNLKKTFRRAAKERKV